MKPNRPKQAAKGRAARRKPLPRLVQAWRFREGVEGVDAAEALLQLAEQGLQLRLAAQAARAALATTPADDPAQAAMALRWQQLQRSADTMRAEWLRDVRELLGHASRDMARETAAAAVRRRAGQPYRDAFAQALASVKAAQLQATPKNLLAKWPAHSSLPADSTLRELIAEHSADI